MLLGEMLGGMLNVAAQSNWDASTWYYTRPDSGYTTAQDTVTESRDSQTMSACSLSLECTDIGELLHHVDGVLLLPCLPTELIVMVFMFHQLYKLMSN